MTTLERLISIVSLHVPPRTVLLGTTRLAEDLALDSLDRFEIGCDILADFKVDLPDAVQLAAVTLADLAGAIDAALVARCAADAAKPPISPSLCGEKWR